VQDLHFAHGAVAGMDLYRDVVSAISRLPLASSAPRRFRMSDWIAFSSELPSVSAYRSRLPAARSPHSTIMSEKSLPSLPREASSGFPSVRRVRSSGLR